MTGRNPGRAAKATARICQTGRRYRGKEGVVDLPVLGIDVGKFEFHCPLRVKDQVHTNHFRHSAAGFERLHRWVSNRRVSRVHARMEATGG
jgi:hypothetical protein